MATWRKIVLDVDLQAHVDAVDPHPVYQLEGQAPWKRSVRMATVLSLPANSRTGNVITALGNGFIGTIDGVTPVNGDRILVKNEATQANNGIYTFTDIGTAGTPFVLTRADDADSDAKISANMAVLVAEGTTNLESGWQLATHGTITLNTTSLVFARLNVVADSGWTAMSGTPDKASTWDTETITHIQLARRVKALEDAGALGLRPNA